MDRILCFIIFRVKRIFSLDVLFRPCFRHVQAIKPGRGTIMQYLKHRTAVWWFQIIMNAVGVAAVLFLMFILFAIYEL